MTGHPCGSGPCLCAPETEQHFCPGCGFRVHPDGPEATVEAREAHWHAECHEEFAREQCLGNNDAEGLLTALEVAGLR